MLGLIYQNVRLPVPQQQPYSSTERSQTKQLLYELTQSKYLSYQLPVANLDIVDDAVQTIVWIQLAIQLCAWLSY